MNINETKIKYLLVLDKLYEVTDINFSDLTLEANETDLLVFDVPNGEIFRVEDFKEFKADDYGISKGKQIGIL